MNGITFAEPLFLYLLIAIPGIVVFYILKQHKVYCLFKNARPAVVCHDRNNFQTLSPAYSFCISSYHNYFFNNCPGPTAEN